MGYLGFRTKNGVLRPDNPFFAGGWAVEFTPNDLGIATGGFEIYHIAVEGPAQPSCVLQLWLDTRFYSTTVRGDVNDYDPNQNIFVQSGQSVNFYWNTTVNPAPTVSIYLREPAPF